MTAIPLYTSEVEEEAPGAGVTQEELLAWGGVHPDRPYPVAIRVSSGYYAVLSPGRTNVDYLQKSKFREGTLYLRRSLLDVPVPTDLAHHPGHQPLAGAGSRYCAH